MDIAASDYFSTFLDVQYRFVEDKRYTTSLQMQTHISSSATLIPGIYHINYMYSHALVYRRIISDQALLRVEMEHLSGSFHAI